MKYEPMSDLPVAREPNLGADIKRESSMNTTYLVSTDLT